MTIGPADHQGHTPAVYQPDQPIAVYQADKTIALHLMQFAADDPAAKAQWLLEQVQAGGCACWMTNTVKRAQQIYSALLQLNLTDITLDLLHARFPLADRVEREKDILKKYGRGNDAKRPKKAIVVGTQVLEQSLDLDFDVMMTDLAPIDLILQRAGRLHRHERNAAVRYRHQEPHLYVNAVIEQADSTIYDEYILRMSLLALQNIETGHLSLPAGYRTLIEAVYDGKEPDVDDPLYKAWDKLDTNQINLEDQADMRLMNEPDPDGPFYPGQVPSFKDDEGSGWLSAPTRWGQESITVIPLLQEDETARPVSGGKAVPRNQKADRETQLALLRQSVRISRPKLVEYVQAQPEIPKLFTNSPLLKRCFPLWLEKRGNELIAPDAPLPVRLHPQLGLVIGELE